MVKTVGKIIAAGILVFVMGGHAFGEDYSDFKQVLRDVLEVMDTFAEELNTAENADEVIEAIEKYNKAITPLKPKMDEMDEKYSDIDDTNHPEELAEVMEEYSETMVKLSEAMSVLYNYMEDERVIEAMEKLN